MKITDTANQELEVNHPIKVLSLLIDNILQVNETFQELWCSLFLQLRHCTARVKCEWVFCE